MGRITTRSVRTLALTLIAISAAHCQISCPEGMYRAWAGDWCCNSKCGPGTSIVHSCTKDNEDNTVCEPCGPDYFNPYADQFDCIGKDLCGGPNEEIKVQGNATTDNECPCKIGNYRKSGLCLPGPECPPGKGATRSGHCEVCLHGTFSNVTSRIQPCLHWQRCPLGYLEGRPGTNVSDVVCTSHPLDWHDTNTPKVIIVETIKNQTHHKNEKGGLPPSTVILMTVGICVVLAVVIAVVLLICRHQGQQNDKQGTGEESSTTAEKGGLLESTKADVSGQSTITEKTLQVETQVEIHENEMATYTFTKLPVADNLELSATDTTPRLAFMTLLPDPETIPVNEDTTDYIEQHLGDDYLGFARGLPLLEGREFTKTDLDSLKYTYKIHGPREAIRETVGLWKTKQGDRATLEGLVQGLAACGRKDMVRRLCELNHVHWPESDG